MQTNGVIAAINAVMRDISTTGIGKNRRNIDQNYKFRGIDDVLNALSPVLSKHGLVIVPRAIERDLVQSTTKSGSPMWKVTVKVEYHVYASDGSSVVATTYGEAMDSADKATNKALSAAYKYLAILLFAIPVEGHPDADETTPEEVVRLEPSKVENLRKLLTESGKDESLFLSFVSARIKREITDMHEVPVEAYEWACRALKAKATAEEGSE